MLGQNVQHSGNNCFKNRSRQKRKWRGARTADIGDPKRPGDHNSYAGKRSSMKFLPWLRLSKSLIVIGY
uniref:Uncharacterized protein n=1 Tax=Arundo donax TaxID=35708 RepID=A0A0A9C2A2_ARUDO